MLGDCVWSFFAEDFFSHDWEFCLVIEGGGGCDIILFVWIYDCGVVWVCCD